MRKVAIVGVGNSKFGERTDVNLNELAWESIREAFEDARITQKDVDFCVVGNFGIWSEDVLPAVMIAEYAGVVPIGHVRCESACATGSAALQIAYSRIASGLNDIVMIVGVEKMSEVEIPTIVELIGRAGSYLWEFENFGLTYAGYYAMLAVSHMNKFGTKEEQMAKVAVKNHHYGAINTKAHLRNEIKIDDVLRSNIIAWPIKLLDCCTICDGSVTIILASEEKARKLTDTPIWIKGLGVAGDSANMSNRLDYHSIRSSTLSAQQAFKMAGIGPKDIDVATVHDCFTIAEILAYEDIGFCKKGEGSKLIDEEQTYVGGQIPVNVDGGLKAKGHPIGATGCSMIWEITRQLRNEVERGRQVNLKKGFGLSHNIGGTGHSCYVTILGRD